ncbi:hypothetical protein RvY_02604 [Ramazzottius varieornatus]|uniref:Uncharacterized protein n=1 Tax=Ramazzottius varieornatus TaxID=947166 RepID=A0A1D1UNN2_RAMVA|nr:hypothetical protein RvY_02604 [Ramazzottius varieornatus]
MALNIDRHTGAKTPEKVESRLCDDCGNSSYSTSSALMLDCLFRPKPARLRNRLRCCWSGRSVEELMERISELLPVGDNII